MDGDVVDGGDGAPIKEFVVGFADRVDGGSGVSPVGISLKNEHATCGCVNAKGVVLLYSQFHTHDLATVRCFRGQFSKIDAGACRQQLVLLIVGPQKKRTGDVLLLLINQKTQKPIEAVPFPLPSTDTI